MTNQARPSFLQIELLSDATFSRAEGAPGVVEIDVEHDDLGLPFIGGKTLRGLLRDSWLSMCRHFDELAEAAERVLGRVRATDESCRLRVGDALLSADIRSAVRRASRRNETPLTPETILRGCTDIRYQTAESRQTGAPETTTLRASRVVIRGFVFASPLLWLDGDRPTKEDLRVLALSALATRHGGLLRNRGRGHLRLTLDGDVRGTQAHAEGMA